MAQHPDWESYGVTPERRPGPVRVRLTVPPTDRKVIEWMANQQNLSTSLRLLIQRTVDRRGTGDMLDSEVVPTRVRRTDLEIAEDASDEALRRSREERTRSAEDIMTSASADPATSSAVATDLISVEPDADSKPQRPQRRNRMLEGALADFAGATPAPATAPGQGGTTDDIKTLMGR